MGYRAMRIISVISAVHPAGAGFLDATADSVLSQELPENWQLEWVLQEDGLGDAGVGNRVPHDDRVRFAVNGARLGASGTRNLALRRVRGELVQNLDADAVLLAGALLHQIGVLERDPELHWAVSQADDLMPDGSRVAFPADLPFGRVERGVVNTWAMQHGGNWPIHCAGLIFRTASLRAMGGWGGVPFDEDLVLFAALSEVSPGWFDETVRWLYRQHPNQMVKSGSGYLWSEKIRGIALQRVLAVRSVGLTLGAVTTGWEEEVQVGAVRKSPRPTLPGSLDRSSAQ